MHRILRVTFLFAIIASLLLPYGASGARPAQAGAVAAGFSEYFIPGAVDQLFQVLQHNDNNLNLGNAFSYAGDACGTHQTPTGTGGLAGCNEMRNVTTISVATDDVKVYYDQWENGYGVGAAGDEVYTASKGDILTFESSYIYVRHHENRAATDCATRQFKRNGVVISTGSNCYDGRDRLFVVGGAVSVAQAFWPEALGTVYANAWEIYPIKPEQNLYIVPVGVDLYSAPYNLSDFQHVYVLVEGTNDGTQVQIDDPTVPGIPAPITLNRGEYTQLYDIHTGTKVISSKPVQVQFLVGRYNAGQASDSRSYTAVPSGLWDHEYFSPVPSATGTNTDLYIYNPNAVDLKINYQDGTAAGTITVPANSTRSYRALTGHYVPTTSGVYLGAADGGSKFWAIGSYDTNSANYNYGFTLIPGKLLTDEYYVSWSPGSNQATPNVNGSPVYVTPAENNTNVYVDFSPIDGIIDRTYTLNRTQIQMVFDPDFNNTGMHVWASGPISLVWGQDSIAADLANPYIDAGYTILPLHKDWIDVVQETIKLAEPAEITNAPQQEVTFTLETHASVLLDRVDVTDTLPTGWTYLPGSTLITRPDGSTSTTEPTIVGQNLTWNDVTAGDMVALGTATVKFKARSPIAPTIGDVFNRSEATATVGGETFTSTASTLVRILPRIDLTATVTHLNTVQDDWIYKGGTFDWAVTVKNVGTQNTANFTTTRVILRDHLPAGPTYTLVGAPVVDGVTGPLRCRLLFTSPLYRIECDANGNTVAIPPGKSFTVTVQVAPAAAFTGLLVNPAPGTANQCMVDPNNNLVEDYENNNNCADSVTVYDLPNLSVTKTNDANPQAIAGSPFNWTLTVNNAINTGVARFPAGSTLLVDELPAGPSYGAVTVTPSEGLTGPVRCQVAANILTCDANGDAVTIPPSESFSASLSVTTSTPGALTNPAAGKQCLVNPNNSVPESSTADNNCANTVTVIEDYTISGRVWSDADGSGAQNGAEPGLSGVTVTLRRPGADGLFGTADDATTPTTTLANGDYSFLHLASGAYRIEVSQPASTTQTGDPDATRDNRTGVTLAGANVTGKNFGYQPLYDIRGKVWNDADASAAQNGSEGGLSNQTVELYQGAALLRTTTTAADGSYSFLDLPDGSYQVRVTPPAGYHQTADPDPTKNHRTDVTLAGADSLDNDFGYQQLGSIGGSILMPDDSPVAGATIDLYAPGPDGLPGTPDDVLVASDLSDGSGLFSFENLPPGDYTLVKTNPPGYKSLDDSDSGDPDQISVTVDPGLHTGGQGFLIDLTEADLELALAVDDATPTLGDPVIFTLDLTNQGPDDASGVSVQFALPAGLTYQSDDAAGSYDPASGTWTVGDLPSGSTVTLILTARVDDVAVLNPAAQVSASALPDPDSTPANGPSGEDDEDTVTLTPALPPAPTAADDATTGSFNLPATLPDITANDTAHGTGNSILPGSVDLNPALTAPGRQDTFIDGFGNTWTVDPAGEVTFEPAENFHGTAQIQYRVEDEHGQSATANLTVTVDPPTPPAADDDSTTTDFNEPVTLWEILLNDTAYGEGNSLDPATIDLNPSPTAPGPQSTFADGYGNTWTVDLNGDVIFDPAPGFFGEASIPYTVQDELGQPSNQATLTVTVDLPLEPDANNDEATTGMNVPVTLDDITTNDTAYGTDNAIDSATVDLDPSTPGVYEPSVTTAEGTWTLGPGTGEVTFTPAENFTGEARLPYSVEDLAGQPATADLIVQVAKPAPPSADDDSTSTAFNTPATLADILANDAADGVGNSLDPATVDLDVVTPGYQDELTQPGIGAWQWDPITGDVTFTPAEDFVGEASLPYTVEDELGQPSNEATLKVTVNLPALPTADDETTTTPYNTPASLGDITIGDAAFGAGNSILKSTIDLDPDTPTQDLSIPAANGTWTVDTTTGEVTFTPAADFTGLVSIDYSVEDEAGQPARATLTVTVLPPPAPAAVDDSTTTPYNTPVTLPDILANDTVNGAGNSFNNASIDIDLTTPGPQDSRTTADGVWSLNRITGAVTFTPVEHFTGEARIPYTVEDELGQPTGADLIVTVTPPAMPIALPDSATTPFNTPVTLPNITTNDTAFGAGNTIVVNTIDLDPAPGPQASFSNASGAWTVDLISGAVTFTPAPGFTGTATIPYSVADELGQLAPSTLAVTVVPLPVAENDTATTPLNTPVTLPDITANDTAYGDGNSIDPATIDLDPATPELDDEFTDANGTWTLDPTTGEVTFTPADNVTGPVSIPYTVEDELGQQTGATLTVTVEIPLLPTADDESTTTPLNTPVSLGDITIGDVANGAGNIIVRGTIDLNPGLAEQQDTFTDPKGSWAVDLITGVVTFTPADNFVGAASIPYTVEDELHQQTGATLTVTVEGPLPPTADDESTTTPLNTPVSLGDITIGDVANGAGNTIVKNTIDLDPNTADQQDTFSNADGSWVVDLGTGEVTFTPADNFVGLTTIPYTVEDELHQQTGADLTVTVEGPLPPTADDESTTTPLNTPVSLGDITVGDVANGTGNSIVKNTIDLDLSTPELDDEFSDLDGTWTLDRTTGVVTFTPADNFVGTTSIPYTVEDELHQQTGATLSVTVEGPEPPTADDESTTTPLNTPVSLGDITIGDAAFGTGNSIVPGSIDLNPGLPGQQDTFADAKGSWAVDLTTGIVTFTPADNFTGLTTIPYTVEDELHQQAGANLTVTVQAPQPPVADDDDESTDMNVPVTLEDITEDDQAFGAGNSIVRSTIDLDPSTPAVFDDSFTDEFGNLWTVDHTTGEVTFTPALNFHDVAEIPYTVQDELGQTAQADLLVDVRPVADVTITKTDGTDTYTPGGTLTYTITVTNLSPISLEGVYVYDARPAEIKNWAWTCASSAGAVCGSMTETTDDLEDVLALAAGESVTYTVTALTESNATGDLVNSAWVEEPEGVRDPDDDNNEATDTDEAVPVTDLTLVKTVDSETFVSGATLTYTLTVTNSGKSDAQDVRVVDNLPAQVTFVSANPAPTTPDPLAWDLGALPAGQSVSITLVVTVNQNVEDEFSNTAVVTTTTPDADEDNNDGAAVIAPEAPTPVEVIYFRVVKRGGDEVSVQWATETEVDTFGYRLLRSTDRNIENAVEVAYLPADRVGKTYNVDDSLPGPGRYYYWLVKIDTTGMEEASDPLRFDHELSTIGYSYQLLLPVIRK